MIEDGKLLQILQTNFFFFNPLGRGGQASSNLSWIEPKFLLFPRCCLTPTDLVLFPLNIVIQNILQYTTRCNPVLYYEEKGITAFYFSLSYLHNI